MKAKLLLLLPFSTLFCLLSGQVPQGFNYQAVAKDGAGKPVTGATIKIRLSILSDTAGFYASGNGTYVWEEEHTDIKTNSSGLFSIVMGDPSATKIKGTAQIFSAIDWAKGPLFIGTKIANPTVYQVMGSAKLWAVPYSMVTDSTKALLRGSKLSVVSNDDGATDALFEVKRKDGQTVFAVYPNAVNIYVPRTAKGTKGGFAIGGFGAEKAGLPEQDYFRVTPDSVRIYIDKTPSVPAKGTTKGGFAIGGFDQTKNTTLQDLFTVSNDSIRMYINRNPALEKGATKGGFAIGGFDQVKSDPSFFLNLTPENYFIGENSGSKNTTGRYNSFLGYETGKENLDGAGNVFIGYKSGYMNQSGGFNLFIGNESGYYNDKGANNVFIGDKTGYLNKGGSFGWEGSSNVFIGTGTGLRNTTGASNVFIGERSGENNGAGDLNNYVGKSSGQGTDGLTTGVRNNFFGAYTGVHITTGDDNVFLGNQAGMVNTTGYQNIFIGSVTAFNSISGNRNVYIGQASGANITDGNENVFLGGFSGAFKTAGNRNTLIGFNSGYSGTGSGNVFIGYMAGCDEINSDRLYIHNSNTTTPLIYGEFDNSIIKLNGAVNISDVLNLKPRATAPVSPSQGDIYFDSETRKLKVYDGTTWQDCW